MFQGYGDRYDGAAKFDPSGGTVDPRVPAIQQFDIGTHLAKLQPFLTLPRETIPGITAREAARYLKWSAGVLGLEFIETEGVAPTFLLLPAGPAPRVLLFQTWHAETLPAAGAIEGAERLALGTAIAGVALAEATVSRSPEADRNSRFALVIAPSASSGSQGLDRLLRDRRDRLSAESALWIRIAPASASASPSAPAPRRRVFLGARGRTVLALRGGDGNPYRARDVVVEELRAQAFGPRPLDFELIRKMAQQTGPLELLSPSLEPGTSAEERIRRALFDPKGEVAVPPIPHPDRPRAWLTFETAESMEAEPIAARVTALSGGGDVDIVERFPWDRVNIHHPGIRALIGVAKSRSGGAEIWPQSPWPTPSGLFSRALGTSLAEWGIPFSPAAAIRFPQRPDFEAMVQEAAELLLGSAQPS